jgi:hypothetical protein
LVRARVRHVAALFNLLGRLSHSVEVGARARVRVRVRVMVRVVRVRVRVGAPTRADPNSAEVARVAVPAPLDHPHISPISPHISPISIYRSPRWLGWSCPLP